MDLCRKTYGKIAIKKSSFYHHDFIKMSQHGANTKYGKNTSFIHQEFIFGPKTALILTYLATFTNLTLNNIQKEVIGLFFKNVPTIGHRDGGTYLKLANKILKSLEEVTSLTKTSIICSIYPNGPFLVLN